LNDHLFWVGKSFCPLKPCVFQWNGPLVLSHDETVGVN